MTLAGHRFLPGVAEPSAVATSALQEGRELEPSRIAQLLRDAAPGLSRAFRTTEPVIFAPAPIAVMREIALRATVEHRALVVIGGSQGAELADTVEALGREVIRAMVHPGATLEPDQLRRFLDRPEVDTVVLAHAEHGTGALAPLAELAEVVRARPDLLTFVDATGSIGADRLEAADWGLDVVIAPGDGALALPPGLSFAAVSSRALARARAMPGRGNQLDLVRHHAAAAAGSSLTPVPPGLALALFRQLEHIHREGLAARWGRHRQLAGLIEAWCADRGDARLLAVAGRRAGALSAIELSPDRDAATVTLALAEAGWQVGIGMGAHPERTLRLGHAGEVSPGALGELLHALGRVLEAG